MSLRTRGRRRRGLSGRVTGELPSQPRRERGPQRAGEGAASDFCPTRSLSSSPACRSDGSLFLKPIFPLCFLGPFRGQHGTEKSRVEKDVETEGPRLHTRHFRVVGTEDPEPHMSPREQQNFREEVSGGRDRGPQAPRVPGSTGILGKGYWVVEREDPWAPCEPQGAQAFQGGGLGRGEVESMSNKCQKTQWLQLTGVRPSQLQQ